MLGDSTRPRVWPVPGMEREELLVAACKQGDWSQFHRMVTQVSGV